MKKERLILILIIFLVSLSWLTAQQKPDEFFGVKIGADKTLIPYPDIVRYFKHLDKESDRIKIRNEGNSTLNNPIYLSFISSDKNLANIERLIKINSKLANPDQLNPGEEGALIDEARAFVLITCSLHATEIAASQMSMLLAHELVTSQKPEIRKMLDNVVVLLMPSINPDGNIMVTEWYRKYLGTEYEGGRMPYLYHHYAGHDNNRDFYMLNLSESRVVNAILHHRYFPHVFLDMHQMGSTGPRMFVPPFKDPLNQNLDPILLRETNIIGSFMSLKLQENNKKGVADSYAFDAYWPGGSKNTAWFKNVVGILTELASAKVASPIYIEPNELRVRSKGLPEYKPQVNFPDPWQGGWWHLKDIVEYEMIASHALVEIVAKNRDSFVRNFYNLGLKNIRTGEECPPYAYLIPTKQWDSPASLTFLKKMQENGVRIYRLDKDYMMQDTIYRKGSYVIPLNQPYRNFIKVMMEKQVYPQIKHMENGPIIEPYDSSGWTLPLQMGVKYCEVNAPIKGMKMTLQSKLEYSDVSINGKGTYYVIPGRYNRSAIPVNRLHKKGIRVFRHTGTGDFLIKALEIDHSALTSILAGTGVDVQQQNIKDSNKILELKPPKIGIYQSHMGNMDEGWTRWILDNFEFSYQILKNKDFLDPKLSKKINVIVFPDMDRESIVEGRRRNRYWGIDPAHSPEGYRGGIGKKGLAGLKSFVKKGGTLVLLDSASELGIKDFNLPFTNVLKNIDDETFYAPGSILKVNVDNTDPLGWGLENESILFFSHSPTFKTRQPALTNISRKVVAGFPESGPHLLSGYIKGEKLLDRSAMIIRFGYHKGAIMVLGGRVQHRAQTFATFKFLFNAFYFGGLKK